jgi:hypothetical protein
MRLGIGEAFRSLSAIWRIARLMLPRFTRAEQSTLPLSRCGWLNTDYEMNCTLARFFEMPGPAVIKTMLRHIQR